MTSAPSQGCGPVAVLVPAWTVVEWLWGSGPMLRALQQAGWSVIVMNTGQAEPAAVQGASLAAIPLCHCPLRSMWDWSTLLQLLRRLREHSVAMIVSVGPKLTAGGLVLRVMEKQRHRPFLVAMEACPTGTGLSDWLLCRALRSVDRILLPTRESGQAYRRLGVPADRLSWLAPPVETFQPPPVPIAPLPPLPATACVLTHVSTSEDDKGARAAIITHEILRYHRPHLHLLVAAYSPAQAHRLRDFAQRLAFDDPRIHIVSAEQVNPAWFIDRVVLVTAMAHSVSVALAAMYQGGVIAGWDTPELRGLVSDGVHGWLVPAGNTTELAERVRRLIDHPQQRLLLAEAARQQARQWSRTRFQQQFARLFQDLQSSRQPQDYPSIRSLATMSPPR
ncbi:MAG: glycosyltransferase [Gemmataceae bacterium]|nr:glycosyltransferase [Gemmataceae bacterium]MDW8242851.1 glycosyltransferase [Thermogemmata sp.]